MKNFLRALKYTWKYRTRLFLSILCAALAAAFWGLNFTAVYPVLKILSSNVTLHTWIDQRIEDLKSEVEFYDASLAETRITLREVEAWPPSSGREREIHRCMGEIARLEKKQEKSSSKLWQYQLLKRYFIRFLPPDRFLTLTWLMILVVIGVAIKGIFEFFQDYLVGSVMNGTLFDLRNRFYRNAIHQDLRQVQENGSAELMARFTNDMETMGNGIKLLYGRVIGEPLRILSCVVIACWISWQLTILFLILVPAALLIMTKASRVMKRATRKVLEGMSSIYKILQETFQGLRVVKAFTMEPAERRKFRQATKEYRDRSMRVIKIDALAGPLIEVLGVAAVAVALLAGAYLVLNQQTHLFGLQMCSQPIEPETLLQLYALLAGMADPVRKLSSVYTKIQSSAAAADRVFAAMDRIPEVQANPNGTRIERHTKEIEFKNICFSYIPGCPILDYISFKVRAGETIAIVGPNGCGKSTLLNMLPRFFDPDHGTITVDGIDIRHANLRTLRKQIGLVTQDTILFDDTIFNNIAYGSRGVAPEEVMEAARKAFAHDFIMKLPKGYETLVGEVGRNLSGGEKQRIALARAILRDPSILILDEFTSQIDAMSDALIHQAIKEFARNRTTFIITHKMHTLEIADRILVLNQGRIEAMGTHADLLSTSELYRSLQEAQSQLKAA